MIARRFFFVLYLPVRNASFASFMFQCAQVCGGIGPPSGRNPREMRLNFRCPCSPSPASPSEKTIQLAIHRVAAAVCSSVVGHQKYSHETECHAEEDKKHLG